MSLTFEPSDRGYLFEIEDAFGKWWEYEIDLDEFYEVSDTEAYRALEVLLTEIEIIFGNKGWTPTDRRERLEREWSEDTEEKKRFANEGRI